MIARFVAWLKSFRCPCCEGWPLRVTRRRQNTMYVDDSLNWFTGCSRCHKRNDEYWREHWADYYGGLL